MADKKQIDLFKRLTQLFRGGTQVRKKVKNFRTPSASTAVEVFKKSYSQVYSNALNAYGSYDRLCLSLDTPIITDEGEVPLGTLIELCGDGTPFNVRVYDRALGMVVSAPAHHPRITGERETVKITFDGGSTLICTPDHPCMTYACSYRDAGELTTGDIMMAADGTRRVATVEEWEPMLVGDLTVDGYNHFATNSIFVHNSRYADFSEMHYTPEIASALSVYAEESCSVDDKNQVVHVYSNNPKIKEILDELYHDTLNAEHQLLSWTYNLCKYGDLFVFNDVHPEMGVINAFPMPVNEVERDEGWDPTDPLAVRFRWVTQGNQILESWQVAHFRLMGNDAFLPYGSSVLESARRIWRQLILIEDAMLVYRVVRSPERRVFYIDVGGIPTEEIPNYMEAAQSKLKRSQVIDKASGRVDLRYNPLCFRKDTHIPLLDGRTLSIEELAAEWDAGRRDQETYSVDTAAKGQIVPGKIVWCGKSGRASKLVKITLDDGGVIEVTPDHKLMLRDGNPIKACDISVGMSLMPLHVRYSDMLGRITETAQKDSYEKVFNPSTNSEYFTHRLIAAAKHGLELYGNGLISQQGHTIHHVNFNKLDNSTSNLKLMKTEEHAALHAELGKQNIIRYNKSDAKKKRTSELNIERNSVAAMASYNGSELHKEHNVCRSAAMSEMWSDEVRREQTCSNMKFKLSAECDEFIRQTIRTLSKYEGLDAFCVRLRNIPEFCRMYTAANTHLKRDPLKSFHKNALGKLITRDYADFKSMFAAHNPSSLGRTFINNIDANAKNADGPNNHKVMAVEMIDVDEDVYNVTVDNFHNLAVQSPLTKESKRGIIVVWQSVDEDYFIPIRGGDSGTKIDTLAGGQHVSDIADVEYIQNKMFSALQVPKAYLGYEEGLSSKATLAQLDIRFSRSINKIQRVLISELQKIGMIHLFAHGFEGEDLADFSVHLSNPSTVAQMQKLELWRTKFEIAGSAPEGLTDRDFLRREIFQLADDQIDAIKEGRRRDRQEDLELEASELEGNEPGGFGGGGGGGGGLGGLEGGGLGGGLDDISGGPDDASPGGDTPGPDGGDDAAGDGKESLFAGDDPGEDGEPIVEDDDVGPQPGEGYEKLRIVPDDFGGVAGSIDRIERGNRSTRRGTGPARTTAQSRYSYNRGRRDASGPMRTQMPDMANIVSPSEKSMRKKALDPMDARFFGGSSLKDAVAHPGERLTESTRLTEAVLVNDGSGEERSSATGGKARLSAETRSMLANLEKRMGASRKPREMIVEQTIAQIEQDISIDHVRDEALDRLANKDGDESGDDLDALLLDASSSEGNVD